MGMYRLVQPCGNQYGGSPPTLKVELPYDPAIPLLGIHSEEIQNTNLKEYMCPLCSLEHYLQSPLYGKQLKCSATDKCIKMWYINGMLLSHKKNEILPFATAWVALEGIMQSEIRQRKTNTK